MTLRAKANPRTNPPMIGNFLHVSAVGVAMLMISAFCAAQELTALHIFSGQADGGNPAAPVVANHNGVLYGTTWYGGISSCNSGVGCGTVFEETPPATSGGQWKFSVIYEFIGGNDGCCNSSTLALDPSGKLYGVTNGGLPNGSVFQLTPPKDPSGKWNFANIYTFREQEGAFPWTPLLIGKGGAIYGAAPYGGLSGCGTYGCGTVVELVPPATEDDPWKEHTLHQFSGGADGGTPSGPLVVGRDGSLYGTTFAGGIAPTSNCPNGCGVVFKLSPPSHPGVSWTETVIYTFHDHPDGAFPYSLVSGRDGVLYGLARCHGSENAPNIFALSPPASGAGPWHKTVLYNFNASGYGPSYLILGANGVLLGTIFGDIDLDAGLVFQLAPPAAPGGRWAYSTLVDFNHGGPSRNPNGVVPDKFGALYGTLNGGDSDFGAVFKLE